MILLISLLILTGICRGFWWHAVNKKHDFMPISMLFTIVSGILLIVVLLGIFFVPYTIKGEIAAYRAVENSIINARATDFADVERAALTQKIIDTNKWLARTQYDNNTLWDIFIPDEINELEPLK